MVSLGRGVLAAFLAPCAALLMPLVSPVQAQDAGVFQRFEVVVGDESGSGNGDRSQAICPEDFRPIACDGYEARHSATRVRFSDKIKGIQLDLDENSCFAENRRHGLGVVAVAVCAPAEDIEDQGLHVNARPGENFTVCPSEDHQMAGCWPLNDTHIVHKVPAGNYTARHAVTVGDETTVVHACQMRPGLQSSCVLWSGFRAEEPLGLRVILGSESREREDSESWTSCPAHHELIACKGIKAEHGDKRVTFTQELDGAWYDPRSKRCSALNRTGGASVVAAAVCARKAAVKGKVAYVNSGKKFITGDVASIQCPKGKTLTACWCHSKKKGCQSAEISYEEGLAQCGYASDEAALRTQGACVTWK